MKRLLFLATTFAIVIQGAESETTKWLNEIAQKQLADRSAIIAGVRNSVDVAERQKVVRKKILDLIGGLPKFDGPLNARITNKLDRGGYQIENLIFDSLPDVKITANLYRPTAAGKYPGILVPLGHWDQGKPVMQNFAGNLALKGFVVLVYDPLGQGERMQAFEPRLGKSLAGGSTEQHFAAGAQSILAGQSYARYVIWDAKRALDYLISRPEVDGARIGATGCSGGGTITTYISALDPRIKVAAPACYMNSFRTLFSGPIGDSEQSVPGFLSSGLDQTDYVELFAPKPWLILSTENDFFTPAGAKQVFDEAHNWYKLLGAEDHIQWTVAPGGHGIPLQHRESLYRWMIQWLKDGKGNGQEEKISLLPDYQLQVLKTGQVGLEGSRDLVGYIREALPATRPKVSEAELRKYVADLIPYQSAPPVLGRGIMQQNSMHSSMSIEFQTEPGLMLKAVISKLDAGGVRQPAVILINSKKADSLEQANKLEKAGYIVMTLDVRGWPAAAPTGHTSGDWAPNTRAWLIGRNLPGMRASDILRAVDLLAARPDVDPARIGVYANGISGVWGLLAAVRDPRIKELWLQHTPYSIRAAFDTSVPINLHDAVMPGFALKWDLNDLRGLLQDRRVVWTDPTDWAGNVVHIEGPYEYTSTDVSLGNHPDIPAGLKQTR